VRREVAKERKKIKREEFQRRKIKYATRIPPIPAPPVYVPPFVSSPIPTSFYVPTYAPSTYAVYIRTTGSPTTTALRSTDSPTTTALRNSECNIFTLRAYVSTSFLKLIFCGAFAFSMIHKMKKILFFFAINFYC